MKIRLKYQYREDLPFINIIGTLVCLAKQGVYFSNYYDIGEPDLVIPFGLVDWQHVTEMSLLIHDVEVPIAIGIENTGLDSKELLSEVKNWVKNNQDKI